MMFSELHQRLNYVTGHRESRQKVADYVVENQELFEELIFICFSKNDANAYKACWILEFVAYQKLEWLFPYLDFITKNLRNLCNDSSIRPLAKVMQLLVFAHYKKSEIALTELQLQRVIEVHFDWLISNTKVASKAYAIRTLYLLGNQYDWIHPELKHLLIKDYANHSSAYKAVAREVLKKLK